LPEGAAVYRGFGTADGMDTPVGTGGGEPTAWRAHDGRLWFANAAGVAVVDPSRIETSAPARPVYVERLLADREPRDVPEPRRLDEAVANVQMLRGLQPICAS